MTDQTLSGREIERFLDAHTKACQVCRAHASRLGWAWHDLRDSIRKASRSRPSDAERAQRAVAQAKHWRDVLRAEAYQHIHDDHDRKKD